jgi:hypothetical protein
MTTNIRNAKRLVDRFSRLVCNVSKRNPGDWNEVGALIRLRNLIVDRLSKTYGNAQRRPRKQKKK